MQSLAALLLPVMVQDLPTSANHFKRVSSLDNYTLRVSLCAQQTQVCEMVAVLLSADEGKGEGCVWEELSTEDAAAIDVLMAKGGKRKRTKRNKSKKINSEV